MGYADASPAVRGRAVDGGFLASKALLLCSGIEYKSGSILPRAAGCAGRIVIVVLIFVLDIQTLMTALKLTWLLKHYCSLLVCWQSCWLLDQSTPRGSSSSSTGPDSRL